MDDSAWNRLEDLFFNALALDPAARAAYLDEACADDPALRLELEAMLAAEEDGLSLALESRLVVDAPGEKPAPIDLSGSSIGPYRLEKRIGEGGMGEVYLARRDDGVADLQVALKRVRPGLRSRDLYTRFRLERQVLARLSHPNITPLIDGGLDQEGVPYLVMPYVEGIPITTYCDRHALSISDRLALFRTVCDAVQHAHRNMVVHRDLKPSNILVTEEGVVKLLDFGIAKLLDPDAGLSLVETGTHMRPMTPEYAAPEQVRGDVITTSTDVYALGVLLYELLTGRRPYRLDNRLQAEVERVICEEPPIRPSTAVTEVGAPGRADTSPEAIGRARRTVVSRLQKLLQGDLDNIIMMALRKEPDRRYSSVEQFAEDIERFLGGHPVMAQKDTVSYRVRKFVRRNRIAVGALAGVFLLVTAFGLAMYRQAQVVAEERDRARVEAEKALQVSQFLEDLFASSDPFAISSSRRDTLRVRDLLAQGADQARRDLVSQPAVQANLLDVLGNVYLSLGEVDLAQPLLEDALALRMAGADSLEVADSRLSLGKLFKERGVYAPAESLIVLALATHRRLLPPEDPGIAAALNALGTVRQDAGDLPGADSLYRLALAIRRNALGPEDFEVTTDMNNLGSLLYQQGKYDEAESLFREVVEIRRRTLGENHPDVAGAMSNLALSLQQLERYEESEALYRESLAIRQEVLGPEHPDVAAGINNLAGLLKTRGDLAGAEPLYREAIALHRKIFGEIHPSVAVGLNNYGSLLKEMEEYSRAEASYLESLAIKRQLYGSRHPSTAATLNNLGDLYKLQDNFRAAEPYLREAMEINRQLLPPDHPRLGMTLETLGDLLFRLGNDREAEALLVESMTIMQKTLPNDHPRVVKVAGTLVTLYERLGEPAKAQPYRALAEPG